MSKHEHIIKLIESAIEGLEQSAQCMEELARVMPTTATPDFSIVEVFSIMTKIPRLEAATAKLAGARAVMSARMAASS